MHNWVDIARKTIDHLAGTIGGRPAGSDNEDLAFDYLAGSLADLGYNVNRQRFSLAPDTGFFILYILGAMLIIAAGTSFIHMPWLALSMPLILFSIPQISRLELNFRRKSKWSQNLIAENDGEYRQTSKARCNEDVSTHMEGIHQLRLVLCAHVDSARANAITNKRILHIYGQSMFYAQRIAILISAMALLVLLGFTIPAIFLRLVQGLSVLCGAAWIILEVLSQTRVRYSPGAYDNAAAVGVLVALAKYYHDHPHEGVELIFLFTGAEENGMIGASEYAKSIQKNKRGRTAVLNFDLVGAGNHLQYVDLDGTILPMKTSRWMNDIIREVDPSAGRVWYTKQSGDYRPFLVHGIHAASIQTGGNARAQFSYHTIYDQVELIENNSLEKVIHFVIQYIDLCGKKNTEIDNVQS